MMRKGSKQTEEAKRKISKSKTGKKHTKKARENMRRSAYLRHNRENCCVKYHGGDFPSCPECKLPLHE